MAGKKKERLPEGVRKLTSGRYQARYPVTVNGVTTQVSAGTFATKDDARDARALALAQLRVGGWCDPAGPKTLVRDWATRWTDLRGGNTKTASFLRSRIVPWWGERRLGDITPIDVQTWVRLLEDDGLSPTTVRALYATFRRMMQDAVEYDVLTKTPCRNIKLPAERRTEIVPLSLEQMTRLELAAPPRYRAMIHLAAWGGLRWGELAALTWECVDLEAGVVLVRQAVKVDGSIGTTKNGKSRLVDISPATVEVLRAHRRDFGSTALLFTGARDGRQLDGGNFRKSVWAPLVKDWSPKPTFHDLRHGHAGHMVMQGMDWKVLSDRLGHHKPSFTADRYGWVRPDRRDVTLAALERAMQS